MSLRRWSLPGLSVLVMLVWPLFAVAQQPEFPELTGRVVDRAELLDASQEQDLTQMLEAHEQATTEQVVVVTLPDLQGQAIEDYGYQLGREWGIGQEGEDNGALLIVAMEERQVRIEVGYGLEGRLTDAQSSIIINQIITPAFREGDFARGIVEGTEAMVQVLGGDPLAEPRGGASAGQETREGPMSALFFFLFMIVMMVVRGGGRRGRGGRGGLLAGALLGAGMGRGGGGGGLGGGGFGGGGGGFGGGGASGGW
ncbi:TPM domain-containing protein [Litchfieldella xinjiangensis]|uniref:TPM domain-containing protein n=1 Tax=Litchfieldella xinjiangensis TaxID=1166948 RepID=UPI0005BA1225|nr:TPM domain-containing protein [Halomonas xinjiangensis]